MPKWEAIMLYCTKCKSICEDSTQTCPNCKRSRGLRPVKPEDEVFFLKVSEGEAAELALLFEQNAVRHAIRKRWLFHQRVRPGVSADR